MWADFNNPNYRKTIWILSIVVLILWGGTFMFSDKPNILFGLACFIGAFYLIKSMKKNKNSADDNASTIQVITEYRKGKKLVDDFVIFDLETTGLNPADSEIIQIGAIRYNNENEIERFNTYVKPTKRISSEITNINGITNEMLQDAPDIKEALLSFKEFIKNDVLIAHNTSFDMKFLQTYNNLIYGETFNNMTLDTLSLARKYINTHNHKLETLKKFLKIKIGSHNSLDDCIVTHKVYMYCKNSANYIATIKQ